MVNETISVPAPVMALGNPKDAATDVAAVLSRAVVQHLKGDLEGALQILTSVSKPLETPELLAARGYLQLDLGQFDAAAGSYHSLTEQRDADAEAWFQEGFALQKLGRPAEALERLRKAQGLGAQWREVPLAIAICQVNLKRYADAIETLDECLRSFPEYVPALFTKGVTLHLTWDLDGAGELYGAVLEREPSSKETLINLISVGLQQKNYEIVREYSRRLLELDPNAVHAIEGLALYSFSRGDYADAQSHYSKLTQLVPSAPEHWLNLGIAYERQSLLEDASRAFSEALRLRPDSVNAHASLALARWKAGDLSSARACYDRAVQKWPERDDLTLSLSHVLEEVGLEEPAELVCEQYCSRKQDSEQVWFRLGYLRLKRGDAAGAIEPFRTAVRLRADWPEAEVNLALAYFSTAQLDESEGVLKGLLSRHPDHVEATKGRAAVELERGKTESSLGFHIRLLELGHTTPETYYNCGVLAQMLGRTGQAIEYYRSALTLRAEFPEALLNLGHALNSEGHADEARACWIPALQMKPELSLKYFRRG